MDCEQAQVLLIPRILGDLEADSRKCHELEAHLLSCQPCAEECENSEWVVEFTQEHKALFAEAFVTIEKKRAAKQEQTKRGWQAIQPKLAKIEAQEKCAKFRRLLVKVSAAAACVIIGISVWVTLSNSKTLKEPVPRQIVSVPAPSIKIELLSDTGNIIIPSDTEIKTTASQLKTLVINDKHRMVLNSDTALSIKPLEENSNIGCLVKLDLGRIYTHVQHDGNPFVVDTVHGKAVITGTTFDIKVIEDSTTLVVSEGIVQFGSEKGIVKVAAGQVSRIIAQSAPTNPVLCNAAKLTAWATGYKAEPILAQVAPTKSYSDTSGLSLSTDEEPIVLEEKAEGVKTAVELIEQAHDHDAAYTLGASVNRQKALSLYQSALGAEPDEKQRLHILYRMAQLNGTTYRKDKGERPNYRRAMELYQEIIDSYPPDEPKVIEAMLWIGGHHTTLREFESAVTWFKKALDVDTHEIKERVEGLQEEGREKDAALLKKALDSIKHYQEIAVDHVDYAASHISYLHAYGELSAIIDKHYDTFIADRAHDRLVESMDKMSSIWAPSLDDLPSPFGSTLQAGGPTPITHSESQKDIQIQTNVAAEVTERYRSVEPSTVEISQKDKHVAGEPRAPPLSYLSKCVIGVAAGLIVLGFAVVIIVKKGSYFLRN